MSRSAGSRRVLAVVANIKQFRASFYPQLAEVLARHGIELRVAYSAPHWREGTKNDSIDLPPPLGIKCPRIYFVDGRLLFQLLPLREIWRADLIIIVQSNGYLSNYPLLLARALGLKRIAFWGHSRNHQAVERGFREAFRRAVIRFCDWWFAYTRITAEHLRAAGVPSESITVINNAVDTRAFARAVAEVQPSEVEALRAEFDISPNARIGLYCGSLYEHKHIDFLLSAARRVHEAIPEFVLIIVGAGPDKEEVIRAASSARWIRYAGPQFGKRKACVFAMAEVFLNPGLVGLAILDSFAAGLPFLTTDIPLHSPEIAYLESGVNGLMLPHDEAAYAEAVVGLLRQPERLAAMRRAALQASQEYTVERMVSNVSSGILKSLAIA